MTVAELNTTFHHKGHQEREVNNHSAQNRASYDPELDGVDLLLAIKQTFPDGGRLSVNAASPNGLADLWGDPVTDNLIFTILPGARGFALGPGSSSSGV
jgi:hypothetical protein